MDYLNTIVNAAHGQPEVADNLDLVKKVNPLTYPKSSEPFSKKLFKNPTSEYRGCPLWAWNTKLEKEQLKRQIDNFADMGLGGFHMHVRTGLDTEYLGSEFMDIVLSCVEYAESKNMLACLYDDDRWPSGSAGGKVIKQNPEHKGKHVLFTRHPYGTVDLGGNDSPSSARASRSENGHLLATYDVTLDENGCLKSSRMLKKGQTGNNVWYAYMETNTGSPWFNDQTYVDTLSPEAISSFIKTTHEVYKDKVGHKFGTSVPCIFTDEPQFATKTQLSSPLGGEDVFLPWTADLPVSFKKVYDEDIVASLPQIFWNLPHGSPSRIRHQFHDHVAERFVTAFMDQLSSWCRKNNLMLNGHMMEEPTLYSQTTALGEAMRCYRNQEMPGMDLLVDWVEYNTAKQASSVSRQNGTKGTMSEIYGVTHWTFTFEGHKGCGDWQAALGITFRVHHLTWVSMAGEGKRDYPACIGYQSPWYKEYGHVEDHFARVGVAMTRGKAVTRVAVVHPIESYWLAFGPNGSGDELSSRDQAFADLTRWLLHGLIDFDFIAESLLPSQVSNKPNGTTLQVGKCEYEVVIVPNLRTIRSSTLKILQNFTKRGGKVIIAGSAPEFVDAKVSLLGPSIERSNNIFWSEQSILSALDPSRELRVTTGPNVLADKLLYQMRQDGDERFVFICNTDRQNPVDTTVSLKGAWRVDKLDTFSGEESVISSHQKHGWTSFPYRFEGCASLLLRLLPSTTSSSLQLIQPSTKSLPPPDLTLESITLTEPNVLILDYASYKHSTSPSDIFSPPTEVLRIDNLIRSDLKIPRKGMAWRQPWTIPPSERKPLTEVTLIFKFSSTFTITKPTLLALEDPETMNIRLNNTSIPSSSSRTGPAKGKSGWWVDEAIRTLPIPGYTIKAGTNTLTITFPFGILTNIERIYILGSFAVTFSSPGQTLLSPLNTSSLTWGDITTQGLPFYVGNIIYNYTFSLPNSPSTAQEIVLSVPRFSSPVLVVHSLPTLTEPDAGAKAKKLGHIAFQPHTLHLGKFAAGTHRISVTAYGNRYNAFGHFHLADGITNQCWPDIWRTEGDWWTDAYNVRPIGILAPASISASILTSTPSSSVSASPPLPSISKERRNESETDTETERNEWVLVSPTTTPPNGGAGSGSECERGV
ncbi:hypothetical protein ONS95_006231 [Cadophora gregata]|uniref:uncharacterized protein n=1 Tax=Cadophora gregata TaxID=51156 RepID=UPI0026DAE637|nr:uncharacterized protein ONS95_006231 [Cadophora gregata]KAK0102625.1 hypothetical protein ONS95_006231 [Cadophora gregata]